MPYEASFLRSKRKTFLLSMIFALLVSCQEETLKIPLRYVIDDTHMDLHISLGIGDSIVNLAVDTGSVGARILESAISDFSKINRTETKLSYGYADGVRLAGILAVGTFSLLPGYFVENLPFMIIQNVTCAESMPNCPKIAFTKDGRGGMFGANLADISISGNRLPNLLELIPGLSNGFYIHGDPADPYLVLGLTEENTKGFAYLDLNEAPRNNAPYAQWSGVLGGSYSVENNGTIAEIDNHQFFLDSGTNFMALNNFPFSKLSKADNVTIRLADAKNQTFTWKFNVGALDELAVPANRAIVLKGRPGNVSTLGSLPYMSYDVLYDRVKGRIGFRPANGTSTESKSKMKQSLGGA